MTGLWILLGGLALLGGFIFWHSRRRARHRRALRRLRLSAEDSARLAELFPLWKRVPEPLKAETEGWIHVFLDDKLFEACGGLGEITRSMQLAVAAPACLLIARRPQDYYERLRSILLYPDAYRARDEWGDEDVRLGESWGTGSVVLSWQSVRQGAANPEDGLNVVIHEFAHQLDQDDGVADGVPGLDEPEDFGNWSRAFAPAFEDFRNRVAAGRRTVLDDYGAESPAEFFSVASETFFERAHALKRAEPAIYETLAEFYGMDPARW